MFVKSLNLFQYNYCFGGTRKRERKKQIKRSFNTTIVSVEQVIWIAVGGKEYGFNTTIVSVEPPGHILLATAAVVSIQLLFRWNTIKVLKTKNFYFVSIQLLFRWNISSHILCVAG